MSALSHGFDKQELQQYAQLALEIAAELGADSAAVQLSAADGISIAVRLAKLESIEHMRRQSLSIEVFKNGRSASASSGELSAAGVRQTVERAMAPLPYLQADAANGLAAAEFMLRDYPDLALCTPWSISIDKAIAQAQACEQAALDCQGINNSNGAELDSRQALYVLANSHGFMGSYPSSMHSISCQVLAGSGEHLTRDYHYSMARAAKDLQAGAEIGQIAAAKALARQQPRTLPTQNARVLYAPDCARSLLGHLLAAASGGAQYNRASFLLDKVGQQIMAPIINIDSAPLLVGGLDSAPFDAEGMATTASDLVVDGALQQYILTSYAARRLGLELRCNSGGLHNLRVRPSVAKNATELFADLGTGLFITEFMGSSVNLINGDYSRGCAGFWIENGQLQYPVAQITVAGNLHDMFMNIEAVGYDEYQHSAISCGPILISSMTIAGA